MPQQPPVNQLIREPKQDLSEDSQAREEQKNYVSSAQRTRREENSKHWAFVVLIWVVVLCVILAFLFKVWHILMPDSVCWLSEAQISKINDFLTTGVLSGSVGAMVKSKITNG